MSLSNLDAVRLNIADKAKYVSDSGSGDGLEATFKLTYTPVLATPAIQVFIDNVLIPNTDYTVDLVYGFVTFDTAPAINTRIVFQYYTTIFTDDELNYFLTDSGDSVYLAAGKALVAMAADAARLSKKHSLSGGGGTGSVVLDTSVTAQELRTTAKAFVELHNEYAIASVPFEALTEVPWTEAMAKRIEEQEFYRES